MPYCSLDDIRANIPDSNIIQLTDDVGADSINQDFVDEAISYGDTLIDGYLRGRYTVPLNTVPSMIRKISIDLAIFHLYSRRFDLDMPETMMQRYKNSIRMLEQIQKGLIQLGIESSSSPGQAYYKTNKTTDDRVFGKDRLERF